MKGDSLAETLLTETLALLEVARQEWLATSAGDRARETDARARSELVAARRARLTLVTSLLARLHEVDAQIDLLLLSTLPEQEVLLERLRSVRVALEREARERRGAPGA